MSSNQIEMASTHDVASKKKDLPMEIILMIINSIIEKDQKDILPSSHGATKTLLAFTQMCRATYKSASTLLWTHCVYLDSSRKCESFLVSLKGRFAWEKPWLASVPTKLFIRPYAVDHDEPNFCEPPVKSLGPRESFRGLYIDPPAAWYRSGLDNNSRAYLVKDILSHVAPTLQKLVIDLWLSEECSILQGKIRLVLSEALAVLRNLEEFVSLRDNLGLGPGIGTDLERGPLIQSGMWPRLRRLGLFHPNLIYCHLGTVTLREPVWDILAGFSNLETVVFAHAQDFPGECIEDVKYNWAKSSAINRSLGLSLRVRRPLKIVFVDVHEHRLQHSAFGWERDPENLVRTVCVSMPRKLLVDGRNPTDRINRCQDWVKREALSGDLWDISKNGHIDLKAERNTQPFPESFMTRQGMVWHETAQWDSEMMEDGETAQMARLREIISRVGELD